MTSEGKVWQSAVLETMQSYRQMIEALVRPLSDDELHRRLAPDMNSVAVLLRHLGGNLQSRWTDFRFTDGEKESRNRDAEFEDWPDDRTSLWEYFDLGWSQFVCSVEQLDPRDADQTILIRGEAHSIALAVERSLTHVAYHVGQMAILARAAHEGEWQWLTIAPGQSQAHNRATWGTSRSRSVFGSDSDANDPDQN